MAFNVCHHEVNYLKTNSPEALRTGLQNIGIDEAPANLAKISHTCKIVGLQYLIITVCYKSKFLLILLFGEGVLL